jgi:phage tail-like protein
VPADGSASSAITASRFSLTIDGVEMASFSELAGITSEAEHAVPLLKKLPGRRNPPTVVLRRGLTSDTQLAAWHETAFEDPSVARKSTTLIMYNTRGEPVARYHLEDAWPAKLEIGTLEPRSDDLYETITLSCARIQRVSA